MFILPSTLKDDLDLDMSQLKLCSLIRYHACQLSRIYLYWFKRYGYLTIDLEGWPWHMLKICSFKKHTCIINIRIISTGFKVITKSLYLWPWPFMLPFRKYGFMRYTCTLNIKCISLLDQKLWPKIYIWPLTLKNDIDRKMYHSKCAALWDTCVHQIPNVYLNWIKSYGQC